jgi:cytochrome c biogenesis protein CcdA
MTFGLGAYGLGFLAGLVSTLSPCVLPILPILLGSAVNAHPRAPLALAAGLALSYALVGTGIAWAGASLGVDASTFQNAGAVVLGLLGVVLLSGSLQRRFAAASAGLSNAGHEMLRHMKPDGLRGQFVIGLVLGIVWSPCVGPTLGAAIVLASQGTQLPQVALLMGLFGIGAAAPVVVLAYLSRSALLRTRDPLRRAGQAGRLVMGTLLIVVAAMILTGLDHSLQSWLVDHSPGWLTRLTTRF